MREVGRVVSTAHFAAGTFAFLRGAADQPPRTPGTIVARPPRIRCLETWGTSPWFDTLHGRLSRPRDVVGDIGRRASRARIGPWGVRSAAVTHQEVA